MNELEAVLLRLTVESDGNKCRKSIEYNLL